MDLVLELCVESSGLEFQGWVGPAIPRILILMLMRTLHPAQEPSFTFPHPLRHDPTCGHQIRMTIDFFSTSKSRIFILLARIFLIFLILGGADFRETEKFRVLIL